MEGLEFPFFGLEMCSALGGVGNGSGDGRILDGFLLEFECDGTCSFYGIVVLWLLFLLSLLLI